MRRLHAAVVSHATALHELLEAVAALPTPANCTESEAAAFRQSMRSHAVDCTQILDLLGRTVRTHTAKGMAS